MFVLPSTQSFNFSANAQLANGLNKVATEKIVGDIVETTKKS